MDQAIEYLWAAGYDLPPETTPEPEQAPKRRGKKAARAKRQKAAT